MSEHRTIVSVVGARPQFVKLAPICRAMREYPQLQHRIIHTGQHYDQNMSDSFFSDLDIPQPDHNLGVGSGTQAVQTARMMEMLEADFIASRPDVVTVYGDTNSTLAATLAAGKLNIKLAHVEAGLRSFNRDMPEEKNRLVADHCSDRLYAPTPIAIENLTRENLLSRSLLSGDVMVDAVRQNLKIAGDRAELLSSHNLDPDRYVVLTLHRASNTNSDTVDALMSAIKRCASDFNLPVVFPVHPRTRTLLADSNDDPSNLIRMVEPLPYLDMLALVNSARVVLTDSGGLQKEAAFMSTPCITLREETEWLETIELGINALVGTDVGQLRAEFARVINSGDVFDASIVNRLESLFGCGNASNTIVNDLVRLASGESGT